MYDIITSLIKRNAQPRAYLSRVKIRDFLFEKQHENVINYNQIRYADMAELEVFCRALPVADKAKAKKAQRHE